MLTTGSVTLAAVIYIHYILLREAKAIYSRGFIELPPKHERARRLLFQRRDMIKKRQSFEPDKAHYNWLEEAVAHMESKRSRDIS